MDLPATYYDVVVRRDPALFEYVRKDLANLRATGPFGSTDEFSEEFASYLHATLERFAGDVSERLALAGITTPEKGQAALDEMMASKEVKLLMHMKHADYTTLPSCTSVGTTPFGFSFRYAGSCCVRTPGGGLPPSSPSTTVRLSQERRFSESATRTFAAQTAVP